MEIENWKNWNWKDDEIGNEKTDQLYWISYTAKLIGTILRKQKFKNKEISEKLKKRWVTTDKFWL